jgi:ligand-binding sensor domain-containing protein/signal transduction histidine kinase
MQRAIRIRPSATPRCGIAAIRSPKIRLCAWLLALGLVGFAFPCKSDDLGAELQNFALRTWTKADGLPDGSVTVIQQAKDGYLWVGTTGGLARFDGVKFTEVALPKGSSNGPAAVTALCEDMAGYMWIGTEDHGIFSWKDGQTQHYDASSGLLDDAVTSLTLDTQGRLWVGTRRGVNRRDASQWISFTTNDGLPDNSVSSVHAAMSGTVWITTAGGICRFYDGRIRRFDFPTTGQERQDEFIDAYEDRHGNLWAFCATYLINLAQGNNLAQGKRINYFPGEKSAMTRIWSLCEGRGGRLWIGASGRGIFCFDGTKFRSVTLNEGRWPNDVRTICEDHEGNLWLGLSDGVLAQLLPQQFALVTGAHGLPAGAATCLMTDALGHIYVGMDSGGFYVRNGDLFEKIIDSTKWLSQDLVSSACSQPDGSFWVGTIGSGLYHIKDGHSVVFSTANGLSDDCVLAVCADAQGSVWAGTRAGILHRFQSGTVTTFTMAEGLPGSPITALLPTQKGELWVGTENGILIQSDEQFHNVTVARLDPQFADKPILGLCQGVGEGLWIGSAGGGLGYLTDSRCLVWDTQAGLLDDTISGVIQDTEANLWLVSPRGLFCVASNSVAFALSGHGTLKPKMIFETDSGTERSLNWGWPRAARSAEGRLWFATAGGLVGIDTQGWPTDKPAPQVHIEAVYVNHQSTPLVVPKRSKGDGVPQPPPKFPAGLHSLEFQVAALSFEAPEKIRFRHKLDGFDADWVETGPERRVQYGKLPSGPYTFHVTACNAEGVWNTQGDRVSFIIPPPLWRAPWALTLYALAVTGTAAGTVRLVSGRRLRRRMARLEQQQAMERERMRIARNMHDEIGSKLTKISFLSERLKMESDETGPTDHKVDSIATTSRELLKALDEMVWAVNPGNDTLEKLVSYLSQYATEYFQDTPVECDLRVQSVLPAKVMSAEFRHNVFLAFEESLSNVLKHAQASRVEVRIQIEEGTLSIRVRDNGLGFAIEARDGAGHRGNGLANIQQHLTDVGGKCSIQSQPGQGVIVELKVDLDLSKMEVA